MTKFLRSKINGIIFDYVPRLAAMPEWETITEQEAYPERFAPVALAERKPQVDITVPVEVTAPPPFVSPELSADASRPFSKAKAARPSAPKSTAPSTTGFSLSGLKGDF